MSLIPLYNYIYCPLRYPDIEDEYLEREALEYIRDNNLTKDYDEVVL